MKQIINYCALACLLSFSMPATAIMLKGETPVSIPVYQPSKTGVMKLLDEMRVGYTVDKDGDLIYTMNKKGWIGYIIFSYADQGALLWNLQVRTQFATKASHYDELIVYANNWNASQKLPKISMKSKTKMVLSLNYPVQYGFNPDEFKTNVFLMFNRLAERVGTEINDKRR